MGWGWEAGIKAISWSLQQHGLHGVKMSDDSAGGTGGVPECLWIIPRAIRVSNNPPHFSHENTFA